MFEYFPYFGKEFSPFIKIYFSQLSLDEFKFQHKKSLNFFLNKNGANPVLKWRILNKLFLLLSSKRKTCFIDNLLKSKFSIKMQEPQRYSLLGILQKNMKIAQKKIYLNRIIYIASYTPSSPSTAQDGRAFNILIESNVKLINEEYCEDIITGFGLFYTGFFINIIEGPEESLVKHLKTLVETFEKNLSKTPEVTRMKILSVFHHINKRYFSSWNGRLATPPVLLEKIEPTASIEINSRHIQNCLLKLYRMSEYLRNQPANLLRAAMDNISDLCRQHLPEVNLIDFLLDSPGVVDMKEFLQTFESVPKFTLYHETIWPLPPDFVPYNILGEDASKKLMSVEVKDIKEEEKEGREQDVEESEDETKESEEKAEVNE